MNSFSIFGLICNSASEFKCIQCFKDIGKDYERCLVWSKKRTISISIALTKLDFNVHAVSACIRKQCHGRRKELDYLLKNLKDFMDFYKR